MSNITDLSNTIYEYDETSLQDVFIMRPNGKIAYLPYAFYTDPSRVIESVPVDGEAQRFFLNKEGNYPINLAGPAVSKVIDWNLVDEDGNKKSHPQNPALTPETGYFVDLRRFSLDRQAIVFVADEPNYEDDQPIAELITSVGNYEPVPDSALPQLKTVPENDNIYLVYFQHPNKTRSLNQCYSYSVSYLTADELNVCEFTADHQAHLAHDKITNTTQHLKRYYADTQVQTGGLHPMDFKGSSFPSPCIGGDGGGGSTCYVANLATFQK